MSANFREVARATTSPISQQTVTEVLVDVEDQAIVFFVGGAGDKSAYYFNGPYKNIEFAKQYFDARVKAFAKEGKYKSFYLGFEEVRGKKDIEKYVLGTIPSRKLPVYIVGHSLGAWNGAHLSAILVEKGYKVPMLITLDPVGEGALVWLDSDIYRKEPKPKADFWINIGAAPEKPDQSDGVADFGERWTVESGPNVNIKIDANHYDAKGMFRYDVGGGFSAADFMHTSIGLYLNRSEGRALPALDAIMPLTTQ